MYVNRSLLQMGSFYLWMHALSTFVLWFAGPHPSAWYGSRWFGVNGHFSILHSALKREKIFYSIILLSAMDKKLMFYQKDLGRSSLQRPRTQHPPFQNCGFSICSGFGRRWMDYLTKIVYSRPKIALLTIFQITVLLHLHQMKVDWLITSIYTELFLFIPA